MRRTFVLFILVSSLLLMMGMSKPSTPKMNINGQIVTDLKPLIINNTTMVPIRVLDYLGKYQIKWETKSKKVTISNEQTSILLKIGSKNAQKNGDELQLMQAPKTYNNLTYVPLRFIGEAFGYSVDWNVQNNAVIIVNTDPNITKEYKSVDLATSRKGAIQLPQITLFDPSFLPEGKNSSYIFPENDSSQFFYVKSNYIYFYEIKESYALLKWQAKINLEQKTTSNDTLSKYFGFAFTSQVGEMPKLNQRLTFFNDEISVYDRGKYGIIDKNGKTVVTHEVNAKSLDDILVTIPEEITE
ncbi:hypothetical protein BVG16_25675 [Paenibacillus selenitireducens]|uniref:Copper amine oxidase-like N-terminal domain-containing protein n=1 Tax=Paenibacillus selenitireducens TaxID=1324314 RepID=A0A1T2X2Q9_9BACL|nr:copper amine oxidase N-terminal domain-containing protein [Paenibacillus selenitireducens]OPA74139.1 hypothetical protein BVG16_25675 [Paenibacillus selenitireducens]